MKISICIITWNEEKLLPVAISSAEGLADEIVVVDTGSKDKTIEIAQKLGARVFTGADRYHKGESRNQALNEATGDWCVVLDADERIADPTGLRTFLETTDAQAVYIRLAYVDSKGQPTLSYPQMRCWRKGTYQYKYRAHEVPWPTKNWGKLAHTDFMWEHRPPPGRAWKAEYTLKRLLLDVEENPDSLRQLYYLGRQYMYLSQWEEGIATLKKYTDSEGGHDRADAWHCIAKCYGALEKKKEQIEALFQACAEQPRRRLWYGELASLYHADGKDEIAAGLLKCALELPQPPKTYITHLWYGPHIYDLLARCLWKLGRFEEGFKYAKKALALDPDDKRLLDNLGWFKRQLNLPTVADPKRIFITGCAKSGTTLLKQLFYAFDDVDVCPKECHISQFRNLPGRTRILVGKRHRFSLFSEHLIEGDAKQQAEIIRSSGIKVVNIIRDGRDVIYSDHNNVSPRRWIAAMRQRHEFGDIIDVEIRYEDLIRQPDVVQKKVAKKLGLNIKRRWSDYPAFVPDEEFTIGNEIYAKRPLDDRSIGKGGLYHDIISDIATGFDQELKKAGYIARSADYYDAVYKETPSENEPLTKAVVQKIRGDNILDLGCGSGLLATMVAQDYVGIDFSINALKRARERAPKAVFFLADFYNLPFIKSFDTVVLQEVLEHVVDPATVVDIALLLAKQRLIVTVPQNIPDPAHIRPVWRYEDVQYILGDAQIESYGAFWIGIKDVD